MIITIDGPVASGKSTIGKLLAQRIGAYYLYTGLLYRGLAYLLMHYYDHTLASISNPDERAVQSLLDPLRFEYRYNEQKGEHILFDGYDITSLLKNKDIDQAASIVSANNEVRQQLNNMQRTLADQHMVVIDGRDAGSVVFAHAEYKFFLTAHEKERAQRWRAQQMTKGTTLSLDQALVLVRSRDERDSQRTYAPLIVPREAQVIDTTSKPIDEIVDHMVACIHMLPQNAATVLSKM